jgi:hypothetical protein
MNKQEIFDTVARHLFTQGEQSKTWDTQFKRDKCMYRDGIGKDGKTKKCAVGILIPDDKYHPNMDKGSSSIGSVLSQYRDTNQLPAYFYDDENWTFLSTLQSVHDEDHHWGSTQKMQDALYHVAVNYNLKPDVLFGLHFEDR